MRKDTGIELLRWPHFAGKAAVRLDAMDGDVARRVVSNQQITAAFIHTGMDWPRRKRNYIAVRRKLTGAGIDPQCACPMHTAAYARAAWAAVARHHIEKTLGRMRPGILHIRGKRHRAALGQRSIRDIDIEERKLAPDALIKNCLRHSHPAKSIIDAKYCLTLRYVSC